MTLLNVFSCTLQTTKPTDVVYLLKASSHLEYFKMKHIIEKRTIVNTKFQDEV